MNRPENVDFILKDIKSNILDNYVYFLEQKIDKAIGIIKLCNTKCAKELLEILGGEDNERN